ncbi:MAG: flagellar filament capping protein FliD [Planctomycetota bacterium JB042]
MAAPLISFGGLATGIDTGALIDALLGVKAKPINLLEQQKSTFSQLKAKYKTLEQKLDALHDAADDVKKAQDLLSYKATSSDSTIASASATGDAASGSFTVTVDSLAKAQSDSSNGFADFDTTNAGSGTISFTIDGQTTAVDLSGSSTNTLEDVRNAINDADLGVTATIVNTGSDTDPYQLVLTADATGEENAFTVDLSGFTGGSLSTFTNLQAASNAQITVNGLTVERSSNDFDDVVDGVSFTALAEGTTTISVDADLAKVKEKVKKYVDAHSDLINFVNSEIEVPEGAEKGGLFNGESAVVSIKNKILGAISSGGFPGGSLSTLGSIGIELNADGTLSFDEADFDAAAKEDLDEVVGLLTTKGDFVTGNNLALYTVPDSVAFGTYAIDITQAATKASGAASSAFSGAGLLTDETITITQDGESVDVELAAGDDIDTAVDKLNDALSAAGIDVTASNDGGTLQFDAGAYGSASSFTVSSNLSALSQSGVGAAGVAATGLDVQGTINGEAATGEGQFLTAADSSSLAGVKVLYSGDAPGTGELTIGADGFFVKAEALLDDILDPVSGLIKGRLDTLNTNIEDIDDKVDYLEDQLESHEEFLRLRFAALEQLIGQLQSQQAYVGTIGFGL